MEEKPVDSKNDEKPIKKFTFRTIITYITIISITITVGYVHYKYVRDLFENDRHFTYLSELEREMSFRTEMGFYYSYYKTVVEETPFISGVTKLMYDKLVEFPKEVNAFNRFNIIPEILFGSVYRYFEPWLNTTTFRQCHMVERGNGLSPVESCIGLGQPIFFYLEAIWVMAGLNVAALFLHATMLSDSILGGILAVVQYFANHSECTRVMWAPNERENLAAPLLLLQTWLVSIQLRDKERRTTFQLQLSIFVLNSLCLLFWQFSQFIFLTQTAIFFVMEQFRIIDLKSLYVFLHSHFSALHTAILLLQGNDMLKSSLYTSFFIVVSAYCLFFSSFRIKVRSRADLLVESWLVFLRISLAICFSFYLKKIISDFLQVHEDSHIWDILYSKFTDFKSFHTLLYTCSEVFDFLPWSTVKKLLGTLLIPLVFVAVANYTDYTLRRARFETKSKKQKEDKPKESEEESDSGIESTDTRVLKRVDKSSETLDNGRVEPVIEFLRNLEIDSAIFYNISQMLVYAVMAGIVMRLKLLLVPQMCVVCSLYMNMNYFAMPKAYMKYVPILWILSLSPLIHILMENISNEMSHIGEFSDFAQEELLEWISRETAVTSAFAGSMPILSAVMLSTRRPIVAHPHYEHFEARERAYSVYKVYGRFTPQELYQEMNKLKVTYLIVEKKYCYGRSSKGCSFEDIWDVETPANNNRPLVCRTLLTSHVDHFYPVFRNEQYAVFNIHDYSVRYMPRSFDT